MIGWKKASNSYLVDLLVSSSKYGQGECDFSVASTEDDSSFLDTSSQFVDMWISAKQAF